MSVVTAEGTATGEVGYWLWCPGCNEAHQIDQTWGFDGNMEAPTFSPSILIRGGHFAPEYDGIHCWCKYYEENLEKRKGMQFKCRQCHSFVQNCHWQFLSDSSHELAGQIVPMVDLPDWLANEERQII